MSAIVPPTSSPSPFASTGRSLLSKLTLPLKSRTRNLTDFHIRPLEPHRKYSPGDQVKGAVVLTIVKPIRITHLTVCLHGFVRVFKSPNAAYQPLPIEVGLASSGSPKKSQYFGNGHASLFQDEQTLCGEGRLEPGKYEFNFELDFPTKGLPSSIDFERGTISYMITSTITRPTSIAATSSCDQKLSLVETVDIGPLIPPKPRTISLEPISKRSRRKKAERQRKSGSQEAMDVGAGSEAQKVAGSPHPDDSASQYGDGEMIVNPRSPVPSEIISTVSAATGTGSSTSSSTGLSFNLGSILPAAKSKSQYNSTASAMDKTITATIEVLKSGCLPGESIPLKISIKHTKPVKSLHGIIVTLYRQGRIDSAPPPSLFVDAKGKAAENLKHEEYYPKSKTGLAGLSLKSAGSSSVFRKDLAQTFAPILVDPVTLTSTVHASVRCPEDVFPTISGVPGQMISFKYCIEVVVDLGGKLAGQQMHVPRLGNIAIASTYGRQETVRDGTNNMLAAWGGSIVDTDHIRREKSVVACLFEITIGSIDSARQGRGRGNSLKRQEMNNWHEEMPVSPRFTHDPIYEEPYLAYDRRPSRDDQPDYQFNDPTYNEYHGNYQNSGYDIQQDYDHIPQPPLAHSEISVPPPEIQTDEGLSDKERARRAEARLLPSQPPTDEGRPSSSRIVLSPSEPLPEDPDDLYDAETPVARSPPISALLSYPPDHSSESVTTPLAPTLEDLAPNAGISSSDDKQELQRQRLLTEASCPSDFPADEDLHGGEGGSGVQYEASAPVLEEDEYSGQYTHSTVPGPSSMPQYPLRHDEVLPKYER